MRSAIKAALSLSVGSTALILSGVAFGQGDTGVGNINFGTSGTTGCDVAGATPNTCKVIAAGTGFIQRQFAVDGKTYIQTVIDDAKGSGFSSEDFVRLGAGGINNPGISSKLTIAPPAGAPGAVAGETFSTGSLIKSGWAVSETNVNITEAKIDLTIGKTGTPNKADDFTSAFNVVTTFDKSTAKNDIASLRIDQSVNLGSATEKQVFATEIAKAAAAGGPLAFVPGFGTVSWGALEMVQATYVGQAVGVGVDSAGAISLANFASETVSNVSVPASGATTYSNLNQATPTYWAAGGPAALTTLFGTDYPVFAP